MRCKHKILFCFVAVIIAFTNAFAFDTTNVVSRKSLFVIPHFAFQQETSFAGGVAVGYYFKSNDISKISSVSGSAYYTALHQFIFNVTPKLFWGENKQWYLYSNLNLRKYPDYFYGVGNVPTNIKQAFTSKNYGLLLQPQYAISKNLLLGISASVKNENTLVSDMPENGYNALGWEPFTQVNLGVLATYDSRNNQFYAENGLFAKLQLSSSKLLGLSTFNSTDLSLDFRHYVPLFEGHVFAYQAMVQGVFSNSQLPFQLLPTLGGRDLMRGYRQGMYRDNLLFVGQAEYRLPIYKRLKMAAFCSAGDVVDTQYAHIDKLKVAYGIGLRYRLNDARVHLRVDFAKNNYGEKMQFYITATEAF